MNETEQNYNLNFENNGPSFGGFEEEDSGVVTIQKVKKPPLYKVLLHNDDYTTMEFVIYVLMKHFKKTQEQAEAVMLNVHNTGIGICGVYTHEIAETKVSFVTRDAEENGHPLLCSFEPE